MNRLHDRGFNWLLPLKSKILFNCSLRHSVQPAQAPLFKLSIRLNEKHPVELLTRNIL